MEAAIGPAGVQQRIAAVDGFRGLAILMVTFYRFASVSLTPEVVGKLPAKAMHIGAAGVDFFFVLSGFLITGILLNSRCNPNYFLTFYINRSLRIFPLYYGSLFFFLIVLPLLGRSEIRDGLEGNPLHLWLYTSNLSVSWVNDWCYPYLDHFWTLAIEEQFYLVWPVVVWWLGPRRLFRFCWMLLVCSATLRIGCSISGIGEVTEKAFTLFRLDGLLLGSIAAILLYDANPIIKNYNLLRKAVLVSAVAVAMSLVLGSHDFTIRYTLVSLFAVFLLLQILASADSGFERRIFENRGLRSLGKYSYAMYVFQNPLILFLEPYISPTRLTLQLGGALIGGLAYIVIMFGITYIFSLLSWNCFERWFLLLRQRITDKISIFLKNCPK